ncbi:hypothetical protein ACQEU3_20520 [Spirillospora sp. CA-253888]
MNAQAHPAPENNDLLRRFATVFHGRRKARTLAVAVAFPVLLTACQGPGGGPEVAYRPPLLPIELTLDSSGNIGVKASPHIVTPVGSFSLQQSLAHRQVPPNETLLIIRRTVGGVVRDYLIKIKRSMKMTFLVNGEYEFRAEANIAVLKPRPGVSGIRVQDDQKNESAPRYAAKRVTTLPTPTASITPLTPSACPRPTVPEGAEGTGPADCPTTPEPTPSPSATDVPTTPIPTPTAPEGTPEPGAAPENASERETGPEAGPASGPEAADVPG